MRLSVDAANTLAEENLGLVHGFVDLRRPWATAIGISDDELHGIATDALVRASRGFDPDRGFRFSTYAYRAMACALIRVVESRNKPKNAGKTCSLSTPCGQSDRPRSDFIADSHPAAGPALIDARDFIAAAWPRLTEQQRIVLRGRFWEDRILEDIGRELGVSKERVRQIEAAALAACRRLIAA